MDFVSAATGRRSIRKYREKDIPQEMLSEVIDTALWAPSGMNRQEWDVVVLRGEARDRLMEIVSKSREYILPHLQELFSEKMIRVSLQVFENFGGAPAVILVYIPKQVLHFEPGMDERARYHVEFERYGRLLSAAALIQNLLLAAHARGFGTCWMTGPKYMETEINEAFGITDKELVSVIPIGYPDQFPPAPPRRKNVVRWMGF